ncbi:CsgG/HfaB family protein [uncultured Polaribacter sp.]|uniref:CsgG/HfaB family protein n=1 Tax=uncultured Polaribacter sp. TaxID=174711 RepID=UPI00261D33B7|nr:CsgG/HfaB family protein [uncultured Polaribacter sp.]
MKKTLLLTLSLLFTFVSFSQRKKKQVSDRKQNIIETVNEINEPTDETHTLKRKVAIARFSNETSYAKGLFYDKNNDPMGKQAVDILSTKLASSGKFILLERQDYQLIKDELKIANNEGFQEIGADYLIIGSITEFGRKNVGESKVFSRSKTQIVEAGISIRLIDVSTGQIIYSEESKGQAETSNKTTLGLGKRTDYDSSLSDKAISAAISQLVENIINNCLNRPWKSYFLSYDQDGIIISGGKSQGIKLGDLFDVFTKGRKVKNPQTGMFIQLPGKRVGQITIDYSGGESSENEFSIVSFTEGNIDKNSLSKYFIKQVDK